MRTLLLLPLTLALSGCTVPKILGDSPLDEAGESATDDDGTIGVSSQSGDTGETLSTHTGEPSTGGFSTITTPNDPSEPTPGTETQFGESSDSLGPGTSSASDTDTDPAMVCPTREGFECAFATICGQELCGQLGSPFDAEGCPRTPCNDTPCGEGEVCYRPDEWGFEGCRPTLIGSENGEGQCQYTYDEECGGHYCVPASEGPPAACKQLTDEQSCLSSGCSAFTQRRPVIYDQQGECSCAEPEPECLWFLEGWTGEEGPGLFYRPDSGEVAFFAIPWTGKSLGWNKCFGDPAEPLACQHCDDFAPENCL